MVPESKLERTEHGLVAAGAGWFVVNAREARWVTARARRGHSLHRLVGEEAVSDFAQFGVNLFVLRPASR